MHVEIQSEKTKANKQEKRTFRTQTVTDPPPFPSHPPTPKQNLPPEFLLIGYTAKSFKKHHVIVNMPFHARPPAGPPTARSCAPAVAGTKRSFRSEDGVSSDRRRKQSEVRLQPRSFEGFFKIKETKPASFPLYRHACL